ncbi:(2Fe-2S)-binding protein [Nitratireductor sp. B36]|uniref:(2Fe-2S)-binding protein n=1 Tax=Nitratireductor sp. B36 TaxID=2762059 RepID=UPI001E40E2AA|nr:(2Fe-2S)-binding protein [Nitratireductor sp. B36]MCC5780618.1 (2Fe-2S)-binding protein [Nitratireductor sp. B36]
MFKRINAPKNGKVSFTFEGRSIDAAPGDTVASALMLAGETHFRDTPVSQSQRGPFCLMGVCFECLVEIDGVPNRQACMVAVREGMSVRRQKGAIGVEIE